MKYPSALIGLAMLFICHLHAATGTKKDPLPSDQTLSQTGGPARNVTYWRLIPS